MMCVVTHLVAGRFKVRCIDSISDSRMVNWSTDCRPSLSRLSCRFEGRIMRNRAIKNSPVSNHIIIDIPSRRKSLLRISTPSSVISLSLEFTRNWVTTIPTRIGVTEDSRSYSKEYRLVVWIRVENRCFGSKVNHVNSNCNVEITYFYWTSTFYPAGIARNRKFELDNQICRREVERPCSRILPCRI